MFRTLLLLAIGLQSSNCEQKRVDTYEVRGQFITLSTEKKPATVVFHHEEMSSFKNEKSEKIGMVSMQMPFALDHLELISDIKKGDKAKLDVEVRWGKTPRLWVKSVTKLPAETALTLTNPY